MPPLRRGGDRAGHRDVERIAGRADARRGEVADAVDNERRATGRVRGVRQERAGNRAVSRDRERGHVASV